MVLAKLGNKRAPREKLTANRTYYVRTDGSDSNTGLVDNVGGAFLTAQKAWDTVCALDLNTYTATIQIGDATYTAGIVTSLTPFGGPVVVQGNAGTPANVLFQRTGGTVFEFNSVLSSLVTIKDLKISTITSGRGVHLKAAGVLQLSNIDFGAVADYHMHAQGAGAFIYLPGAIGYSITGGAQIHMIASDGALIQNESKTITLTGTPAFSSSFAQALRDGELLCRSLVFSGSATGTRFIANSNSVIETGTGGNLSHFPGSIAGTWTGGSVYDNISSDITGTVGTADNAIVRADGTGGKTAQGSIATISDGGNLTIQATGQFQPQFTANAEFNGTSAGYVNFQKGRNFGPVQSGDDIGTFIGAARDSTSAIVNSAYFSFQVTAAPAAGSVDSKVTFFTTQAAAQTAKLVIQSGLTVGSPTGGDKGFGAINASDIYNDNVALTCMALASEFLTNGVVDTDFWDSLVPPIEIPEHREMVQYTEEQTVEETVIEKTEGGFVARKKVLTRQEQVIDLMPVWDEVGNGLTAIEVPAMIEKITPARTELRRHELAHLFKKMVEDGFDPRDPVAYITKLKADEALPGMLTKAEWQHGDHSTGELFGRLWLATEMLALVVINLHDRVTTLESNGL